MVNKKGKPKKDDSSTEKEEVCEVYEVEKKGGEEPKVVKTCGTNSVKNVASNKDLEEYDRILKKFLFGLGIIFLIIALWVVSSYFNNNFEYEGIPFNIIQEGEITFYRTYLPLSSNGERVGEYNIYLRNDPRDLEGIPLEVEEIVFRSNMVINSSEGLACNGYGIIAVQNLVNMYGTLGVKTIKDSNATCDAGGKYVLLNLQQSNETTMVKQIGPSCYEIYIKDCEVLEGTEKFLIESLKSYGVKY
jgi:hypothetical protein